MREQTSPNGQIAKDLADSWAEGSLRSRFLEQGAQPVPGKESKVNPKPHPFFLTLDRPAKPNNWLIAPRGFPGKPDEMAPTFPIPAARLRAALEGVMGDLKSVREESRDGELTCYVDETAMFHFKDDICVQFISLGAHSSTIAAYSASRVGYWDLGTNRKRLRNWLEMLRARLESI